MMLLLAAPAVKIKKRQAPLTKCFEKIMEKKTIIGGCE
jgi:hypothetical protein